MTEARTEPDLMTPRHSVSREDRADGPIILRSNLALGPVARCVGDWLHRWAEEAPQRVFIAERSGAGWREARYAETLAEVRAIAAALLARGLGPDRPIAILSGSGVDHALLALAGQHVGVPTAAVAEQYSLIPDAHERLRYVLEMLAPGMVFAADGDRFADALALARECVPGVEIVTARGGVGATALDALRRGGDMAAVDAAHGEVGPDTLAKILFTSGSSSQPKGVPTTQRMLCVNQAQIAATLPFLTRRPPKILDWLPWNHVFGGSHNFNMMLAHGGSYYVDNGRATPDGIGATLENIRAHAGTLSFNVPIGYAMLVSAFRDDAALRRRFFEDLDLIFYAGASMPPDIWTALEDFAREARGAVPLMTSSWGMTETAPAVMMLHEQIGRPGVVGVPVPGVEVKLLPDAEMRCELRVKGPNIMRGYYKDPGKTAESFDEEGFLITGDALRFVDADRSEAGMMFDGRISEDFKLMTGTWVHASRLRIEAMAELSALAADIVITGHDRREVGILVFPDPKALKALGGAAEDDGALVGAGLAEALRGHLEALARKATGSSNRIARALVLAEPPSVKDHEITNKGNLNVRSVLKRRAGLVERLYAEDDPAVTRI